MRLSSWLLRGVALAGLSLMTSGCVSRLALYDVRITLPDTMKDSRGVVPYTDVHLMALSPADTERLNRIGPTEYWDPNRRRLAFDDDKYILHFGGERARTGELARENPVWRRWSRAGAVNLFILANLRQGDAVVSPENDPGREIIPLQRTRLWFKPRWIIDAWIDRNGVGHEAPRRPWEQSTGQAPAEGK
jgi:hypothetical protein